MSVALERIVRQDPVVAFWGIYSDIHPEVDLTGDDIGLLQLADLIDAGGAEDLPLGEAPTDRRVDGTHPLNALRLQPTSDTTDKILFRRDRSVLLIAGERKELARILAGPIRRLAETPEPGAQTRLLRHVHFDPTSDPENRWYAADSISIVISRAPRSVSR